MKRYFRDLVTVYTTTKQARIKSPAIAILNLVLVTLVWIAFLFSINLDIRNTYKSSCPVRGVVLSKVKGVASTEQLSDQELAVPHPEFYRRTWDSADLVYPPQGGEGETGSFTVLTNLISTVNQTLGKCVEAASEISNCSKDSDCRPGYWSHRTHGVFTGNCVNRTGTCQIRGWCPIELNQLPRRELRPLFEDVENFTVMLKNTVEFPECGAKYTGANIRANITKSYLRGCNYNRETDPYCPIFRIGDIVKGAGANFTQVAVTGGVFRMKVTWNCDFDYGRTVDDCRPEYEFVRVRTPLKSGWNFRSADFYSKTMRTLKKQYGLKILIDLNGEGTKFDFFRVIINMGSTIGFFSVAPLVCDFLLDVFNFLCRNNKATLKFHDHNATRYDDGDEEELERNNAKSRASPELKAVVRKKNNLGVGGGLPPEMTGKDVP